MQVTLMPENYDDYYRKRKEDYLKDLAQKETDESELLSVLEYHGLLDYYGLEKLRKLRKKPTQDKYYDKI